MSSHTELNDLHARLESRHKIYKFKKLLESLSKEYERIYIDTPPVLNFFSLSAIIAANSIVIPFDCDNFSRNALYELYEHLQDVQEDHNDELKIEGIVVNQFQSRANQSATIVDELREEDYPVMATLLHSSVKMRESHDAYQPLIHFAPSHKLTQQFLDLYEELEAA